jgi:glycine/D-amino acid oxidase-like deaminating enzyme
MAHRVIQAAVARYGASLQRAHVTGFRGSQSAVSGVLLDDGSELGADVVINAAGPEAGRVAALAGANLPLDRQLGMFFTTAPAPVSLNHVLYGSIARMRPDGVSRIASHPEYLDSHGVEGEIMSVTDPLIERARREAEAIVPGLAGVAVEAVRVGIRPMPRDGQPIVGFDPRISGLYTVVTHSGITLAARLALLVTEELSGGDTAELEPYRSSRFVVDPVS